MAEKVKSAPLYGILLSLEGLSGSEAAGANVCRVVPPIKGGGGCRGSVWSIQVCPPPCRPGEGELSAEQGSLSAALRTQDFTRFPSLAQGVCAAPVTNTGSVSRQAIFSQCGEKFELFCCTCVQSTGQVTRGFGIPVVSLRGDLGG